MAWVSISDDIYDNPKFAVVGPLGLALFVAITAHCNRNLSDGYIYRSQARLLLDFDGITIGPIENGDVAREVLGWMVSHNLLHEHGHDCATCHSRPDGGKPNKVQYLVHDYLTFQKSRKYIKETAKANRERVRRFTEKKKQAANADANGAANALANGETNGVLMVALQTTPTPTPSPTPRGNPVETLGGGGNVGNAREADRHRPLCSKHGENHDGPCRACQRRREWDEQHEARAAQDEIGKRRALIELRKSCPHCDENGMMETASGMIRCTEHREAAL
jgi:hypothetical protein